MDTDDGISVVYTVDELRSQEPTVCQIFHKAAVILCLSFIATVVENTTVLTTDMSAYSMYALGKLSFNFGCYVN